jgi:hypothetical protein
MKRLAWIVLIPPPAAAAVRRREAGGDQAPVRQLDGGRASGIGLDSRAHHGLGATTNVKVESSPWPGNTPAKYTLQIKEVRL